MSTSAITQKCEEVCNQLLRVELSLAAAYDEALKQFLGTLAEENLLKIHREHRKSAANLERHLDVIEGKLDPSWKKWSLVGREVQSAANLLGRASALNALVGLEKTSLDLCRDTIHDTEVGYRTKDLIRRKVIPSLEGHLEILKTLKEREE